MNVENDKSMVEPSDSYTIDDNGDVTIDVTVNTDKPVEVFVQSKEDYEGSSSSDS